MPVAGSGRQGGVEAVPSAPYPWLQRGVALPHGRDWGPSGSTRPASCSSPGARMAHSSHRHRVIPEDVLEDALLCSLSWMAKVSLNWVWDHAKPTHPHLSDGPQAHIQKLWFLALCLSGDPDAHVTSTYTCVCVYMTPGIQMYMLCIYSAIYAKFHES